METKEEFLRQKQFLPQDQTPNHEHKEIQTSAPDEQEPAINDGDRALHKKKKKRKKDQFATELRKHKVHAKLIFMLFINQ